MKIENTLESRLGLVARQVIPEMRNSIFGKNPSRKFFD
jgi:V-type H+-transporting ATPase subunit E